MKTVELAVICALCLIAVASMGLLQFLYSQYRRMNIRLRKVEDEVELILGHTKVAGREQKATQRDVTEAMATVKDELKKLGAEVGS